MKLLIAIVIICAGIAIAAAIQEKIHKSSLSSTSKTILSAAVGIAIMIGSILSCMSLMIEKSGKTKTFEHRAYVYGDDQEYEDSREPCYDNQGAHLCE